MMLPIVIDLSDFSNHNDVQSALSLTTFRRKLKAHLFQITYPDIILQ